jgi:hypothetical protein
VLVVSAGLWVAAKVLAGGGFTVEDLLALLVLLGFVGSGH